MATFPFNETHDLFSPKYCKVPVQMHTNTYLQQLITCSLRKIRREKGPSSFRAHVDACMQATG